MSGDADRQDGSSPDLRGGGSSAPPRGSSRIVQVIDINDACVWGCVLHGMFFLSLEIFSVYYKYPTVLQLLQDFFTPLPDGCVTLVRFRYR